MATFKVPDINDNPDGWGPPMDLAPARFRDMPYAPFSKSDKIGRAADWTAHGRYGSEPASASDFKTVDTKVFPRPSGRGGYRGGRGGRGGGAFGRGGHSDRGRGRGGSAGAPRTTTRRWDERRNYQREASVEVGSGWEAVEEFTSSALTKMSFRHVSEAEDLAKCGSLHFYDRTYDRVTVKKSKPLKPFNELDFSIVQTTDDPVIRRIAGSGVGTVFATASTLAVLMVAPRSVQSWDIVVQRIGGKLFFETRDVASVNLPSVNETSHDAPKDEKVLQPEELVNSLQKLAVEASNINHNFSQAVLSSKSVGTIDFDEPNPFQDDEDDDDEPVRRGSSAYRYRKWELGADTGSPITVVARCELNCAMKSLRPGADAELVSLKTLNEYFDRNARQSTDWRGKLDTQRGAVLATEVKNNANKLARWTSEALLADASQMKFGFVSRVRADESAPHIVLGTQMYRPKEFAAQINLNWNNMWGILKHIIDMCYKHLKDGGKAVIMKDPNKPIFRFYTVPADAFEEEEEEEEEEENGMGMDA